MFRNAIKKHAGIHISVWTKDWIIRYNGGEISTRHPDTDHVESACPKCRGRMHGNDYQGIEKSRSDCWQNQMLKTCATYFTFIRSVTDVVIISGCWMVAFFMRFYSGIFSTPKGVPSFESHVKFVPVVICVCYFSCWRLGLYEPQRVYTVFRQLADLLKACLWSGLFILAFFYFTMNAPYSRGLMAIFLVTLFLGLLISRIFVMSVLRRLRSKGYNLRHYAVIGAKEKGQRLVQDIRRMEWSGLRCAFFVDDDLPSIGSRLLGVPVYGPIEKILELIKVNDVDEVYVTLDANNAQRVYPILESLQRFGMTMRIVPDWGNLVSISKPSVVPIGSQVLFSSADSPLNGYNVVLKRVFDLAVSAAILVVVSIPMLVIALLIKLGSEGPVFYRQLRIGIDQKEFEMLKFRTMRNNAEEESRPKWAKANDGRCKSIGKWLRRTSLDELPQLMNVVRGQMSLVGPRPERPYFVKHFSEEYRKYMLRHKVKTGMTGWAQVNGFRGNTSARKRLVYDLYYVRNWSFAFDLWILLRTPWHVVEGKNAY